MLDTNTVWEKVLHDVETNVSKANFSTWFKNTHIAKEEDGIVYIGVPNEFVKEWLYTKYHKNILKSLREGVENVRSIEYIVSRRDAPKQKIATKQDMQTPAKELPLGDFYINREDNLNPRYTFDSFVIGPFNELAYSAIQAILNNPCVYNPLFIYGGTGLGKTHLIQAVGNAFRKKNNTTKVYYTTLEKFSNDYVNAVQNNKINIFKEKYRKYDVLIMDDIQFLTGKEKTQEELFHVFNTLYDSNKQIVFSSDKHPNFIAGLEDRSRSRFSAGMIIDVGQPDYESRVAIIKAKLGEQSFLIQNDVIEYIAQVIQGNIRELEGVINAVICQTRLKGKSLSLNETKGLIKASVKPKKNVSINDVIRIIAGYYNIEEESLYEKTRRKEIVKTRQVAMYILREDYNVSYPLIGKKLGGKDHTTVIHSYMKVRNDIENDSMLTQELDQIRGMLNT